MTQMTAIKQLTDLRDEQCLKKLSCPISYLYALFSMKEATEAKIPQKVLKVSPSMLMIRL